MNVLFVVPNFLNRMNEYLIQPSIELCLMSKILKNEGHKVELLDMRINHYEIEELSQLLSKYNPDIICIEDTPEVHCNTKKIIMQCRKKYGKNVKICIRGEIGSFEPQKILERNEELDIILRYDTDYTLSYVIKCLLKNVSLLNVPNIAYRNNKNKIIITELKELDYEINDLPMPDRRLYEVEKYLKRDSETVVRSTRGCPGKCIFCIKTKFEKFRLFSIKRFCDEIEELVKMGFETFFFSDATFAFSLERLQEFAEEIKYRKLDIKWTSNFRIVDVSEEKLKLMKETGAYRVYLGIETINEKASITINKNLKIEQIKEKVDIIKKYGIQCHTSFILGNPGDTEKDLEKTIEFIKYIEPDIVTFNFIKIYPGLELYVNSEKYNMYLPDKFWYEKDDWSKDVVMGTNLLPPEILKKWKRRMIKEFIFNK